MTGPTEQEPTPARQARLLLRAARAGTLATASDGQPFASLVTPATAPDGSVLLLLSDLSEHTKRLRRDGRCAIMVQGTPTGPNPQTAPRLTLTGTATPEPDPALHARWVALHPYAAFYAGFGDFHLWRLHPTAGHLIGGFARAHCLDAAALGTDLAACAAVAAAEPRIIAHCNADHTDALDAIAADGTGWTMVACDTDGFDLNRGETTRRIPFPAPADGPAAVRAALVHLAGAAKSQQ